MRKARTANMIGRLKATANRLGYHVISRRTADEILERHPWLEEQLGGQSDRPAAATPVAGPDSPRLTELRRRYAGHRATAHTVWATENVARDLDITNFRGDNVYVWQTRSTNPIQYLLSTYYVRDNDPLGLFEKMHEDGAFGAHTYEHNGRAISRDMLDSILEITFLDEQIGLATRPDLTVLDIGAGYGRLAYRMAETLPNLARYFCVDAVAESTVVSELYIRHRGVEDKVTVIPLDEAERVITTNRIDVAVNIHSFSECALSSIEFWLDLIDRAAIPWIFVVPNTGSRLISSESDGSRLDALPIFKAHGYTLALTRDKYHRSADVQKFGLFPSTYFLFKRDE
jgi:2-polyprenyl-3-methyl-5-hydroxy-6-metoxy-1,4-benzoquinol methylase